MTLLTQIPAQKKQNKMKIERQFAEVRASGDDRKVKFIFSTNAKDRHGTRINPKGWRLDNFNKNGIASFQHRAYGDPDPDMIIGKANAWNSDNKLVGTIDFETKEVNPLADKLYQKVKAGTLNAVSVGFVEHDGHWGTKDIEEEDEETYYFDDIELMEISLVTVPSNPEALAYRGFEQLAPTIEKAIEYITDTTVSADTGSGITTSSIQYIITPEIKPDLTEEVIKSINMEDKEKDLPENSKVDVNVTVDASEIKEAIRELGETLKPKIEDEPLPGPAPVRESKEDKKTFDQYSLREAILNWADPKKSFDGVYKEMHQEGVKANKDAGITADYEGFLVPTQARATLQESVTAAGGATVSTDLFDLIGTLRNKMVIAQAGMTMFPGLVGNVSIPRRTSDSSAAWRSEGGLATQSDPAYESVTMEAHRLTAYTRFSRQFLRQSSIAVESEVRNSLAYGMANELEQTAFDGAGTSHQPEGIWTNSSVNNADHGSNGTLVNWTNIVNLEGMVAADNALGGKLAYITNSTMGAYLKTLVKTTNQGGFIWENFTGLANNGMVNGYPAYVTNVISNALTKGTGTALSAIVFGNWADLILGSWGATEYIVDPYTRFNYDEINVISVNYFDYALRHPESFATIEAGRTS